MARTLKEKIAAQDKWIRLIFMVLFSLLVYWVVFLVIWAATAFQFLYSLFVGTPNQVLLPFTASLSEYVKQIVMYLTYNSEEKPFPFMPWPESAKVQTKKPKKTSITKD
jgi:hypothetical protein